MKGRAIRRHHRDRLKARRRSYWAEACKNDPRRLGIAIDTPKPCSCLMCRNARPYAGPTIQELRQS